MVLFVGDKPSKLNDDPNVAFVGTPSYRNLKKWADKMGVPKFDMVNSQTAGNVITISIKYYWHNYAIIALGNNAAYVLKKMGIPHFKLPHPSPRNRLLNDPKFIDSELEKCKNYLKGIK